eukprot:TRINITY_DN27501_c0_g1_i1.p1 TRINITY_DN27501_c0_g1~~TRINITY_DN27501_c0_g1_i1.p1  ORF type:complete len:398 (+),score=26.92 TRINITY_DN27501_c0_g1_i1:85-1278(+)
MVSQKIVGEWILEASILGCESAVFGRLYFTESGELVYLAEGTLVGRGVGSWLSEGPVVGFQLDVFQYEPTSVNHVPNDPHRFRGIAMLPVEQNAWTGEWHYCVHQQPPRLVGNFKARRRTATDLVALSLAAQNFPTDAKKIVIANLDKISEPPEMLQPRWIPHSVGGALPDVHYVRKWLEPDQVKDFERAITQHCRWDRMATRDTQEFGSSSKCRCGRGLMSEPLPSWQQNWITALHNLGVFHPVLYPANSVRINSYAPGQGIYPHMDGPVYYPRAAIISLGSPCVFDFYSRYDLDETKRSFAWDREHEVPSSPALAPGAKPAMSLVLEPGSLLVFSGDAFVHHRHGIEATEFDEISENVRNARELGLSVGDRLERGKRISLTIRHLLPRCKCGGLA